ncbi:MAG: hypothetical protein KAJ18_10160, partial [Candidatus Omnitrophica bacterium]|nr:hypothetical protein [Candidatus Omnitrophota bacterium]
MTKTQYFKFDTIPSLFPDKPALLRNLFLRNKANFNYSNIIATPYSKVTYNALQPKTQNGTNPNKANFRNGKSHVFQNIKKMENEPNSN